MCDSDDTDDFVRSWWICSCGERRVGDGSAVCSNCSVCVVVSCSECSGCEGVYELPKLLGAGRTGAVQAAPERKVIGREDAELRGRT